MNARRYLLVIGILSLLMLMTSVSLLFAQRAQAPRVPEAALGSLPVLGQVGDFELIAATGQPFRADRMAGKVWVVDFIFTSCAGICPIMTGEMAKLHRAFDGEDRVEFVSISVDPETDTPEVLAEYGEKYGADPERWHFLTGAVEDIHAVSTQIFKVGALDEPINHSSRFILVDGTGAIRGYYIGTDKEDIARLTSDIAEVLAESSADAA